MQSGDLRLTLERGSAAPAAMPAMTILEAQAVQEQEERNTVRSPISGVFYLSKEPGAEPFVSVGARVSKGDTDQTAEFRGL